MHKCKCSTKERFETTGGEINDDTIIFFFDKIPFFGEIPLKSLFFIIIIFYEMFFTLNNKLPAGDSK